MAHEEVAVLRKWLKWVPLLVCTQTECPSDSFSFWTPLCDLGKVSRTGYKGCMERDTCWSPASCVIHTALVVVAELPRYVAPWPQGRGISVC